MLLGVAGLGAMVWVAVDQFDIPWQEMLDLLLLTLLAFGMVIGAAALAVGLWQGLRWLLRERD